MSNRLKEENSQYLLQHSENPVDWYPWGKEAFEKAKKEKKPIFLSIGYSTCHWCHVMARESFENKEIAEILNQFFVAIKVDREERPDIDSVYMSVCQALTGSGGWPMSIFMTAEQKPFFAGTYFPPVSYDGRMGFRDLLLAIAEKWKQNSDDLLESAEHILEYISFHNSEIREHIDYNLPKRAVEIFSESFDKTYGGFGDAPKFPMAHNLIFLILYSWLNHHEESLHQVEVTLEKMRRGGIFDQIGYGFSRYSTDRYFLVPHFEKMLYDNALLIIVYALAYQKSHNKMFIDTAEKTAEFIFQEMCGENGAFYSARDADSEGEEGKFYLFSYEEIIKILGKEKGEACNHYFGITKQGNFEGKNIPNLLNQNKISDKFDKERKQLYNYRKSRAKLSIDDKILTSWNALMITAMAILYRVTRNNHYLLAARNAQKFIEENLIENDILYVTYYKKKHSIKGFLDEYAYYTMALISLYEASLEPVYLERAEQICKEAKRQFADKDKGGYFLYGIENSKLIVRPKESYDGALPSGNSVIAYCFVRLSQLTHKEEWQYLAEKQLAFMSMEANHYPAGYSMFLLALLFFIDPPQEITIVLSNEKVEDIIKKLPFYATVKIMKEQTKEYKILNNKTTYYVCKNHTCLPPSNDLMLSKEARF